MLKEKTQHASLHVNHVSKRLPVFTSPVLTFDSDSGKRVGLIQVVVELQEKDMLHQYEDDIVAEIGEWFNNHLDKPGSFNRSSRPHARHKAISWFKPTAKEHIEKMYQLASIIEEHGIRVHVIRTDRPGYIVYEDEYQITAEPFNETKT